MAGGWYQMQDAFDALLDKYNLMQAELDDLKIENSFLLTQVNELVAEVDDLRNNHR